MPQVTIYTTPTCVYCKMAKQFLTDSNVSYQEIDVAGDPTKAEEMFERSGQMGVPVMIIKPDSGEEQVVVGFQKDELAGALGINNQ